MKRFKITEGVDTSVTVCGIQDCDGQAIAITDSVKGDTPEKIIVTLEATHTGINRNKVEYTAFGLQSSVDSWTKDYNKPVLLNHNTWSDPLGRVLNAEYKVSVIDASKYCIQLSLEITNKDAIERFLDGRYRTFSIGGYTDSAKCSICGKDQMKDGWCGHSRGRKYADKECYWTLGTMDYDEISVVNCPADPNAQTLDITIVESTEDGKDNKSGKDNTTPATPPVKDGNTGLHHADGIGFSELDGILGINGGEQPTTDDTGGDAQPQTDDTSGEGQPTTDGATGEQPATSAASNPTTDGADELQGLRDKISLLTADITVKDDLIASKDAEIVELNTKLADKDNELQTLKSQATVANEEISDHIKQNVSLARLAHKIMCQRAVDVQLALGVIKKEDKDALLKDYATYTTQKLEDLVNEQLSVERTPQKEQVKVDHPGASQVGDATVDESASGEKPGETTMEDYAKTVLEFFTSKM